MWMSSTQGVSWQLQTAAAQWDIRDSMMGASFYSTQLQRVVIIHSGGHDDSSLNFRPNEVWGSSDQGVSWTLFPRAPYVGRNHASMQMASNGVLVVVAGKTDIVTGSVTNTGVNDVWVSVSGGTSWSLCTGMANFRPRQDLAATIDSAGYLYVSSGIDGLLGSDISDLWKSPISFLNLQSVQQACGVQIPACGVGLRCWPAAGKPYNCPCDFQLKGADAPAMSQLTLNPLNSPFSTSTSPQAQPTCSPLPLPAAPATSPFLIQAWSFCYQTYSASSASGPYSTVYSGQITTSANATYSAVTGQLGYAIVSISGYRTQFSASGVLSSSAITGFSLLATPITIGTQPVVQQSDPYLYVATAPTKTNITYAQLSSAGIVLTLDTAPILPNGLQALSQSTTGISTPQQWLAQTVSPTTGQPIVIEGYLSLLSSTGSLLTTVLYPDYGNMTIASVSANDYVNEAVSPLPSCPLNFAVFSSLTGVAPSTYTVCGQAVSSATSPAAPWSVAVSATVTVAAFPTLSATTGQYAFPILSISSGGYSQQLATMNSSAAVTGSQGAANLYLQSNGAFSFDTNGLTLLLSSSVALPSTTSTAHATNLVSLAGGVPATSALTSNNLTAFAAPGGATATPWSARHIPGLAFIQRPVSYINAAGASATASGASAMLVYGGQLSTTVLYNDVYLSTNSGASFTVIAGPSATAAQNALYTSPLVGLDGSIKMQDSKGRLYAISGSYRQVVQYSDNALQWTTVGVPFHGRAYCFATADPMGNVYVMGGQGMSDDHTGATGTYLNDGKPITQQHTLNAQHTTAHHTTHSRQLYQLLTSLIVRLCERVRLCL